MDKELSRDLNKVEEIAKKVAAKGGRTFFVGGYVRDKILGKENKDVDIEIHNIALEDLQEILKTCGDIDERKVGDNFGIFALKGFDIDIALPRAEKPSGEGGHKDFIIEVDPFIGYKNAAKRRDFTINALMEDVLTGEILDYFGGVNDLASGIIKHVDSQTFVDDPLRVLRAAQFAARFNFRIDDATVVAANQMSLKSLSRERVSGELAKALMKSDRPSIFFDELRKMNQLRTWFPEVEDLIGVQQTEKHHPEGDVYNHTMLVLDEAAKVKNETSNGLYFMVSALCHDFGKAVCTEYDDNKDKWVSYGHHEKGVPLSTNFVNRVFCETKMQKYVNEMTLYHMQPRLMYNCKASQVKWMEFFDKLKHSDDLIFLCRADNNGRLLDESFIEIEAYLKDKLRDYRELMETPEVSGQDLIDMGYKSGPEFSKMLQYTHANHLRGITKDVSIERMIAMFGMSDKLKKEHDLSVTGKDLIALGYDPGPEFKKMLTFVHDDCNNDLPKEEILEQVVDKFGMSDKLKLIRKQKNLSMRDQINLAINTADNQYQQGD